MKPIYTEEEVRELLKWAESVVPVDNVDIGQGEYVSNGKSFIDATRKDIRLRFMEPVSYPAIGRMIRYQKAVESSE